MSNELERKSVTNAKTGVQISKSAIQQVWNMLRHNIGWKVLALFLAVALWVGLITQDPTLTREKTFTDVPVTIVGLDSLKRSGRIPQTDLNAVLPTVRLKVDVPQKEYNNVTAANYNVRVDLSRITADGVQDVKITATSSSTYGSVVEIVPDTLQIAFEEYKIRYRIPVTFILEGDPPAGYYSGDLSVNPHLLTISGPASLVDNVSRAVVVYDQSVIPGREWLARSSVPIVLVDERGNEISLDQIEITNESVLIKNVIVEQMLYETKTIELLQEHITTGTPSPGYEVKSITVTPSQVVVAGRSEALSQMENVYLEAPVDINGRSESFTTSVRLVKPVEIENISSSMVTVVVEIVPIQSNRSYENIKIGTLGLAGNLSLSMDKTKAGITINGPKIWLDKLKAGAISLTADLTGLKEGVHNVPILCTITDTEQINYTYATDPAIVQVTLTNK